MGSGASASKGSDVLESMVLGCAADTLSKVPWPTVPSSWRSTGGGDVVILDVGKGAKLKSIFFKLFPSGKFMTVQDFCDTEELWGRCVVVIHGGPDHRKYLQDGEKAVLKDHLSRGGSMMSLASGSTFLGCNKGCMALLPVFTHDRQNWQRGTGEVEIQLSHLAKTLFVPSAEVIRTRFFNGPALVPLKEEEYQSLGGPFALECGVAIPFATYLTEMNECSSETSLVGMPAVIGGEFKEGGRFVAISPNMEINPSSTVLDMVDGLLRWVSKMEGSSFEAIETPIFGPTYITGTRRDQGSLVKLPFTPKLAACSSPGPKRLVILDLGKGVEELEKIFSPLVPEEQRAIIEVDALPTVQTGDVVLLHGGMANEHADRLGVSGRKALRSHLHRGGSLLGICAGAHWLSCRDLPLWGHAMPLVPHDNSNWRRGVGDVTVTFTDEGKRILDLEASEASLTLRYANGPLLVALPPEVFNNFQPGRLPDGVEDEDHLRCDELPTPLAIFSDCSDARVEGWPSMQGHAAAWAWQVSSGGRAIALAPHPEYAQAEQSRQLFRKLLLWCLNS